jgi:hypothetical protein
MTNNDQVSGNQKGISVEDLIKQLTFYLAAAS